MNFDWTEEQVLLRASTERFCAERYGADASSLPERRRRHRADPVGFPRDGWRALADLGLAALPFAESDGGLGGGPAEIIAVAEPLGRSLALEPFTDALVPSASLLSAAGGRAAEHIAHVVTGDLLPTLAVAEAAGRYNIRHVETRAHRTADGWRLTGAKIAAWHGLAADLLLVTARLHGDVRDAAGIGLFAVPAAAAGIERRGWRAADAQVAADVTLRDVPLPPDALLIEDAADALDAAVARAWLSASAEMLGAAGLLLDQTIAYVKQRTQFGRALGGFQVIQHRLTDCYVAGEQARSMVYRAAVSDPADFNAAAAAAQAYVADAARRIAHEAVQLHGGMGMTDELVIGHGLKRIRMLATLFGDATHAADAYSAWRRAA